MKKTKILTVFLISMFCSSLILTNSVNAASVTVTVNLGSTVVTNALRLGFQLDGRDISSFRGSSNLRQLATDANMAVVRFFPQRLDEPLNNFGSWSWDWTLIDDLVTKIIASGAEPMPVLGFCGSSGFSSPSPLPDNPTYDAPYVNDFKNYTEEWVEHFVSVGLDVNYYELVNEAHHWFGWGGTDTAKRSYFGTLYNAAYDAMKAIDGTLKIGFDNSMISSNGLSTWLAQNIDVDFLSWHAYLTGSKTATNSSLITAANTDEGATYGGNDFIVPARTVWNTYGHGLLPVIQGEGNLNYAYTGGTDPRIQSMLNAVTEAIRIRMYVYEECVTHHIFFDFAGDSSSSTIFGMVDRSTLELFPPYYTFKMIQGIGGLTAGNPVFSTSSSSSGVYVMGWNTSTTTNILLINSVTTSNTISFSGVSGTWDYYKIDEYYSGLQEGTVNLASGVTCNGYSVVLLQSSGGSGSVDNAPSVDNVSHNTTIQGDTVRFDAEFSDDVELSHYVFSTNNTGVWANQTATAYNDFWDGNVTDANWSISKVATNNPAHGTYNYNFTTNNNGETNKDAHFYVDVNGVNPVYARALNVQFSSFSDLPSTRDMRIFDVGAATSSSALSYFGIYNEAGTIKWMLRYYTDAWMQTLGETPVAGTNYDIEYAVYQHATAGFIKVWIDGVQKFNVVDINTTALSMSYLGYGLVFSDASYPSAVNVFGDCVTYDDSVIGEETENNIMFAHYVTTLNATAGSVGYRWYTNDSSNNWVASSITYIGSQPSENVPVPTNPTVSDNRAGYIANFTVTWSDIEGLSGYIFGTNNTGTWVNQTWLSFSGSPTQALSYYVKTLNSTVDIAISWIFYANDTDNNWNDAYTEWFFITNPPESENPLTFFATTALYNYNEALKAQNRPYLLDCNGTVTALSYSGLFYGYQIEVTVNATAYSYTEVNCSENIYSSEHTYSTNYVSPVLTVYVQHASETDYTLVWMAEASYDPSDSSGGFQDPLFQYLLSMDLIGFVFACYTSVIGSLAFGIPTLFVSAILYIRQKSLFIVSVVWLLVGAGFISAMAELSPLAVIFTVLGIAGVLVQLILTWRKQ